MKWIDCPPWIDPGNAFRVHVSVDKYTANTDYDSSVEIAAQKHDVWFDLTKSCSMSDFVETMATKIIWGRGQQLLIWGIDKESETEWKVTSDEQFRDMIEARWDEKEAYVGCEVVDKDNDSCKQKAWDTGKTTKTTEHSFHATSGVTAHEANVGTTNDDASSSPKHSKSDGVGIDWSAYTILPVEELDGEATMLMDEEQIYEAMGLNLDEGADGDGSDEGAHVVYLEQRECTCREWQVSGKPCSHALAAITTERQPDMAKYVHEYYSVKKFQAAYAGEIPNITDKQQWPVVNKGYKLCPPVAKKKKGPGRLRKNRIPSCLENTGKAIRQVTCKNCGELGHRATSWRCPLSGTKKRKRTKKVGRPKDQVGNEEEQPAKKKIVEEGPSQSTPTMALVAREAATPRTPRTRSVARKEAAALQAQQAQLDVAGPPSSKRRLELEEAQPLELIPCEATVMPEPKKMTPRRKVLATKVKKATPTKDGH